MKKSVLVAAALSVALSAHADSKGSSENVSNKSVTLSQAIVTGTSDISKGLSRDLEASFQGKFRLDDKDGFSQTSLRVVAKSYDASKNLVIAIVQPVAEASVDLSKQSGAFSAKAITSSGQFIEGLINEACNNCVTVKKDLIEGGDKNPFVASANSVSRVGRASGLSIKWSAKMAWNGSKLVITESGKVLADLGKGSLQVVGQLVDGSMQAVGLIVDISGQIALLPINASAASLQLSGQAADKVIPGSGKVFELIRKHIVLGAGEGAVDFSLTFIASSAASIRAIARGEFDKVESDVVQLLAEAAVYSDLRYQQIIDEKLGGKRIERQENQN